MIKAWFNTEYTSKLSLQKAQYLKYSPHPVLKQLLILEPLSLTYLVWLFGNL